MFLAPSSARTLGYLRMIRTLSLATLATVLGLVAARPVVAQAGFAPLAPLTMTAAPGPHNFASAHRGTFGHERIAYHALVNESMVRDGAARTAASLVTIAYVADPPKGSARRPVLFVFNGGPGGSSAPLHFGGMGPKILRSVTVAGWADSANPLLDNPLCPLDVTDLVFIDPVDTGFSHSFPGLPSDEFHSIDSDSDSITQLIIQWLRAHARATSPVYLYGESYGSMRAVALARDLTRSGAQVQLRGIILGGEAITYGQGGRLFDPVRASIALPMMASVAWHYGKIDNQSQTWEQAVERARSFGRSQYLQALLKGYALGSSERDAVIRQLAGIIGIPESYFQAHNTLVVRDFNRELLKDRGLVLDSNDGLETHPAADKATDDEHRDWDAEFRGLGSTMAAYAFKELKVDGLGSYHVLTPNLMSVFDHWNFITTGAPSLNVTLATVMKDNPAARILVLQGRFDTLTQLGVTEYTMDQVDVTRDRLQTAYFDGGHFLNGTPEAMAAIHRFVDPAAQP
jgi:carboxypeptidase C (cathepsin A)